MAMAQTPELAQYDGMPRSAIATGLVDYIQPVEQMPETLIKYIKHFTLSGSIKPEALIKKAPDHLHTILAILRTQTKYDFRCYKKGTLLRRIGRRMGLNHIKDMTDYVRYLRDHPTEVMRLFKDLLIGVTGFFREPEAFKILSEQVFAELVQNKGTDTPVRVWVPACATGEEPYSIAMLLIEQLQTTQNSCPLQIFATDIDEEALAVARNGVYPENIAADLSPARLRRFFKKNGQSYQVNKQIRDLVVFAVQNVISDPPFPNLDLISCRNLLIYLELDIQKKLIALFHFALNNRGHLFLGNAETIGQHDDLFEPVSKRWRVYRRTGAMRRHEINFPILSIQNETGEAQTPTPPLLMDSARLGKLTQQLLLQDYAPASVLINHKPQILYYYGPTDRYLKQPTGAPTEDLMARARQGLTATLRTALSKAIHDDTLVTLDDARIQRNGTYYRVKVTVKPVKTPKAAEGLLLVCFEDESTASAKAENSTEATDAEASLVQHLEYELKTTREELQSTIEEQESSNEELKAANEEIMSVNEELRSTNEELETSKEELQSLNQELTTVNNQLQDKVGELEATNNDLNNLLSSTDISTIFLDTQFHIKRFTPATTQLLNLISTDVGRPLSDISSIFSDEDLLQEAHNVLEKLMPLEKEVPTKDHCYIRRIAPYRTEDNRIDGLVITFIDITARKRAEQALIQSKREAEKANRHKSQFLAAANHDLRQPLQALHLFTGLLAKKVKDPQLQDCINSQKESLKSMKELLDAFLNLSKLEAGVITPNIADFQINELLEQIHAEYKNQADSKGLTFRGVPCSAVIRSDPVLLKRIVQNLISNAIKHTDVGKVLIGCRRRGENLRIEIWDTGIGIPQDQLKLIFDGFYQLDNPARELTKGLGLGLSIVEQLARLLEHDLDVQSKAGKGSLFAVQVPVGKWTDENRSASQRMPNSEEVALNNISLDNLTILLVEHDPVVLKASQWLLQAYGVRVITSENAQDAFELAKRGGHRLDVVIADYRLPQNESGIELIERIRALGRAVPAILVTGDTSPQVSRQAENCHCELLHKPLNTDVLITLIHRLTK
jgi:two-component system CheB/CheR fusion protein